MLKIADTEINSRLFIGTSRYPSPAIMQSAIKASGAEIITVSIGRQSPEQKSGQSFWEFIQSLNCHVLPNTAGCRSAQDAINHANMAREIFNTHWIKLEVTGDEYTLQPDPIGLLEATKELIAQGFEVFPYCTDDLVLCKRLVELGCRILMPWGSPIGSGQGLLNPYALKTIRKRFPDIPLVIDAGIRCPSDAVHAMELGYDAILLNSAIALAQDPVEMAEAFRLAVEGGRKGYLAGAMPERELASPSTPVMDTPFWQREKIDD